MFFDYMLHLFVIIEIRLFLGGFMEKIAIIEIGSNNTKTHVYDHRKVIYDATDTIEFKKNYGINKKILESDLEKLYAVIEKALEYTKDIYVFGCSIFRNISQEELADVNNLLMEKYNLKIRVVSQSDEAAFTAYGCFNEIDYTRSVCIFIGGGGSIELIFVKNKEIVSQKYFDFGVVDVTNTFKSLKEDYNTCSFEEVYQHIENLIGDLDEECDLLILAGGDHLYWYNNARYELEENTLYKNEQQKYMIPIETSDKYDHDALKTSLNRIRNNSDNPLWFDGSRAMKVITNVISHKVHAKYIIPTKINMESGLIQKIEEGSFKD